jgi:hypothetical protein
MTLQPIGPPFKRGILESFGMHLRHINIIVYLMFLQPIWPPFKRGILERLGMN